MFDVYERYDRSAVVAWLPVVLGLVASVLVALLISPVPRARTLSGLSAFAVSATYVTAIAGAGSLVFSACGGVTGFRSRRFWTMLLPFCGVTAWLGPVIAFYMRHSLWAAPAAAVLAATGSKLVVRYHRTIVEPDTTLETEPARLLPLIFAGLLLHAAVLSSMASMPRAGCIFAGVATVVISFVRERAAVPNRSPNLGVPPLSAALGLVFVAASLTPYLKTQTGDPATVPEHLLAKAVFARPADSSRTMPAGNGTSSPRHHPMLQRLFGAAEPATDFAEKQLNASKSIDIVVGNSYPGMILRPEIDDRIRIVPPPPARKVLSGVPRERNTEPLSIPFDGAYWFFKASDGTLPADAVESRGDPAFTSFKTTDFTPIAMEARQNLGALIDMSCCGAIEVTISNGDRRPGTVAIELILTNTRSEGQHSQSLGICAVNSTLRWFPGDDRPPVQDTVTFRLPRNSAIQEFDEFTVRFHLRSPREQWSAKIGIQRFRLVPHSL